MSQEKKKNLSEFTPFSINSNKIRIGIVVSEWNDHITDSLLQGARQTLLEHGVSEENIVVHHVPGSFELPSGADLLYAMDPTLDAVICIGCKPSHKASCVWDLTIGNRPSSACSPPTICGRPKTARVACMATKVSKAL